MKASPFLKRNWFQILMVILLLCTAFISRNMIVQSNQKTEQQLRIEIQNMNQELNSLKSELTVGLDSITKLKETVNILKNDITKFNKEAQRLKAQIHSIRTTVHPNDYLDSLTTNIRF